MSKLLVLSAALLLSVSCSSDVGKITMPDEITWFGFGICCTTGPGGSSSQHRDFPRNNSLELNLTFINGAGVLTDVTTQATYSVDDPTIASLDAGTVACSAMPSRRCKVMRSLNKLGATELRANWNGESTRFSLGVTR